MTSRWITFAGCVALLAFCLWSLTGCAAKRHISTPREIAQGHLGKTVWKDCKLSSGGSQVVCKCQVFDVSMDAKTGNSVMRCAEETK